MGYCGKDIDGLDTIRNDFGLTTDDEYTFFCPKNLIHLYLNGNRY
jgi:hypothetical protein